MSMQDQLSEFHALLPIAKSLSLPEYERRAGEFLKVMALITEWRYVLSAEKIRLISAQTAIYAQELGKGSAKTVTENKIAAEASKEYTGAREELEHVENDLNYLKANYEIFNNAHLFYRNLAKGESF